MTRCCAIDFGTSNSAIALPDAQGVTMVELEPGHTSMPTAVFYAVEDVAAFQEPVRTYGRAAIAAYGRILELDVDADLRRQASALLQELRHGLN